ncbi:hypothetical protein MMC30_005658 [Trapelia coarctata]|nr:hypothetical protein [Trapelia coarctata]
MSAFIRDTASKSGWMALPLELKNMVMHLAPDTQSLLNLIRADPSMQFELKGSFRTILPAVISRVVPPEDLNFMCWTLNFHEWIKLRGGKYKHTEWKTMVSYDEKRKCMRLGRHLADPLGTLEYFTGVWKSVEFFVRTLTECLHESPVHSENIFFWPPEEGSVLSQTERNRIRYYLWLFQLCCDLSKYWIHSEDIEVAREGGDSRLNRMIKHLEAFDIWRLEKLWFVYKHLESLLGRTFDIPRAKEVGKLIDPLKMPIPVYSDEWFHIHDVLDGAKAKVLAQGLPFLYTYLRIMDLNARTKFEGKLSCIEDQFFVPAMEEIKRRQPRYWRRYGYWRPWGRTEGDGCRIRETPSEAWRYFVHDRNDVFSSDNPNKFGFCMWSRERLGRWKEFHPNAKGSEAIMLRDNLRRANWEYGVSELLPLDSPSEL